MTGPLHDRSILVTGATGFIGGALARSLALDHGANVVGTGRRTDEVIPSLEGTTVTLENADLRDTDRMRELVDGAEIVFHVAAWLGSDKPNPDPAHEINVTSVESLVKTAAAAGVKRFVQVSTIGAYGVPPDSEITEEQALDRSDRNDEYGRTKAEGEARALSISRDLGLELSIVRPGMVYGPGSWTWTAGMFDLVKKGVPTLLGPSDGHASVVHIDDLVELLILAATEDSAVYEAYNGVTEAVPWHRFFGSFGELAGRNPKKLPMWLAGTLSALNQVLPLGLPLNKERIEHYKAKPVYSRAKTRALGWEPKISWDEGMRTSAAWLREIGKL